MIINKRRSSVSKVLALVSVVFLMPYGLSESNAQSRNFRLTQGLEIQYNILRTLATEYVDTINFTKLLNYGIDAMLESIDPYTEYVPEENQESIEMITTASYGGIGATIRKDSLGVMIVQAYEGSPAVKFNIEPGDVIMKINGEDISELAVDDCSKKMRGNPGTKIKFVIKKGKTGEIVEKTVVRERVHTSDVPYYGLLRTPSSVNAQNVENVRGASVGGQTLGQVQSAGGNAQNLGQVQNVEKVKGASVYSKKVGGALCVGLEGVGAESVEVDAEAEVVGAGAERVDAGGFFTDIPTGYIKISSFTLNGSEDVRKALISLREQGAQRIVLDLRGNGGGLMDEAADIVSLFVPKGTLVASAKGRSPEANFDCVTDKEPVDTLIPLLVLVNSSSASSSEIVAGALQDLDRATVMGTRTYGKGLVQSFRPVGYSGKLKLTIAKYYTPSGRCIQILDYAHRNSDGSVGTVPDSLKKAFKTKNGRTVYDGGGITPDFEVRSGYYSRPTLALSLSGIPEEYAIQFYTRNSAQDLFPGADPSAKQASDIDIFGSFRMTDSQWQDFVKFAAERNFDQRSSAEVVFDQMLKEAKAENMYEKDKEAYDQLSSKIKLSKEEALNLHRDEIQPLIEEEIVQKYAFSAPRVRHMLDYDTVLKKALRIWDGKEDGQPEPQSKEQ